MPDLGRDDHLEVRNCVIRRALRFKTAFTGVAQALGEAPLCIGQQFLVAPSLFPDALGELEAGHRLAPATLREQGLGIAQLPLFVVADEIETGRLRRLLSKAEPPAKLASIVFPSTRAMPRRVRVVVDHLAERATPLSGTTRRRG